MAFSMRTGQLASGTASSTLYRLNFVAPGASNLQAPTRQRRQNHHGRPQAVFGVGKSVAGGILSGVKGRIEDATGTAGRVITATFSVDRGENLGAVSYAKFHLVDKETGKKTETHTLDMLKVYTKPGNLRPKIDVRMKIPEGFGTPEALVITDFKTGQLLDINRRIYLSSMLLQEKGKDASFFYVNDFLDKDYKQGDYIFFANCSYLPADTPAGLMPLRDTELKKLRGENMPADWLSAERKEGDVIYDYAVYDDLGVFNSDTQKNAPRPALGGNAEFPFPRRVRTNRPKNPDGSESAPQGGLSAAPWLPANENFRSKKQVEFKGGSVMSLFPKLTSSVEQALNSAAGGQPKTDFANLKDINEMFSNLTGTIGGGLLAFPIPKVLKKELSGVNILNTVPKIWDEDEEFARQRLAGSNPCTMERATSMPSASESNLGAKLEEINALLPGDVSLEGAIADKRVFKIDYSIFRPWLNKVNALEGRHMYAPIAWFYKQDNGKLKPIAIELLEADSNGQVYTPKAPAWQWRLAKAFLGTTDSGLHQLVSHYLRCHACTEPYIIACHRHLSELHPMFKLLFPHFRYTLKINANARNTLINAGGIVEKIFVTGKYGLRIAAQVYGATWTFENQSLPNNLKSRGILEEDASGNRKMLIEDYPYACDGLLLWDALRNFNLDYIKLYYKDDAAITSDPELMAWWKEIQEVGHADIKTGWPALNGREALADIVSTIAWVSSAHHSAVNFGQFDHAAYMPNHPCTTRRAFPKEGTPEWDALNKAQAAYNSGDKKALEKLEDIYLATVATPAQAITTAQVMQILSTHAGDEQYIGERDEGWTSDPKALEAFDKFSKAIKQVDAQIDAWNKDPNLLNRTGAFVDGYTLLQPTTPHAGLTCRGVPNSVSI